MKNKKISLVLFLLLLILIAFYSFFKDDIHKQENINPLSDRETVLNMKMFQLAEWKSQFDMKDTTMLANMNYYIDKANNECKEVINGIKPDLLESYGFIDTYFDALGVIEKNEYLEYEDVNAGNCNKFSGEDKLHCEIQKSNDITFLEANKNKLPLYNYVLLESIITKKNTCDTLLDEDDINDCNKSYKDFTSELVEKDTITMYSPKVNLGKYLHTNGEEKYLSSINKSFMDKCNFYVKEFKEYMLSNETEKGE